VAATAGRRPAAGARHRPTAFRPQQLVQLPAGPHATHHARCRGWVCCGADPSSCTDSEFAGGALREASDCLLKKVHPPSRRQPAWALLTPQHPPAQPPSCSRAPADGVT